MARDTDTGRVEIPAQTTIRNEDFETMVLVSGIGEQHQNQRSAQDLYTSEEFSRKRECAKLIDDSWSIISPKYGSLSPTGAYIKPYEITLGDYPLDLDEHPEAQYETLGTLVDDYVRGFENRIHNYERWDRHDSLGRLVLLLEDDFLDVLREDVLDIANEYDVEIVMPFEGMTDADKRMELLSQWIEEAEPQPSEPAVPETNSGATTTTNTSDESDNGQSNLGAWS